MRFLLLPLAIWPLASTASNPFAEPLGSLAFIAASASAASAPAELPEALPWQSGFIPWRPVHRLRASSVAFLHPRTADGSSLLASDTSPQGGPGVIHKTTNLEAEALAIDAELVRSEQLIGKAWEGIRHAPLIPTPIDRFFNHMELTDQRSVFTRLRDLGESVPVVEWYFFVVTVALVVALDLIVLQHLPEIDRTHVGVLAFWLIVAVIFCAEVWSRQGQREGIAWASGYLLEIIFSIENVFIFNLIFHTLETPRRLMRKALMLTLIGSIFLRFAFIIGLADVIYKLTFLPYILGAWLICCGTQQVTVGGRCEEEGADVTQTPVVRALRWCLGDHFGEFYDEQGEAIFVLSGKRACMTLLGAVVACLLTTDLLFGSDAMLVKSSLIPNMYVRVSSSVIALFTLRALFFVVRDILSHLSLARYCTGLILLFVGAEMLVARFTEVSALMSLIVIVNVIMLMAMFAAVKDSACPKRVS